MILWHSPSHKTRRLYAYYLDHSDRLCCRPYRQDDYTGKRTGGFFLTAALGIAGSLGATYLGHFLGWYQAGESAGFFAAIVGAIVLLLIYHLITRKSGAGSSAT